jgi:hypothetical protein
MDASVAQAMESHGLEILALKFQKYMPSCPDKRPNSGVAAADSTK